MFAAPNVENYYKYTEQSDAITRHATGTF